MNNLLQTDIGSYIVLGVLLAVIIYIAVMKNVETRRILSKYDEKDILLLSLGVFFYGTEKTVRKPRYIAGAIALTKTEIFFQRRLLPFSVTIPLSSVRSVGVSDTFMDQPAYSNIVVLSFNDPVRGADKAGFKIPHPDKWIQGIRTYLDS